MIYVEPSSDGAARDCRVGTILKTDLCCASVAEVDPRGPHLRSGTLVEKFFMLSLLLLNIVYGRFHIETFNFRQTAVTQEREHHPSVSHRQDPIPDLVYQRV